LFTSWNDHTSVNLIGDGQVSILLLCLPECLTDEATPVTGWYDLWSLLDYGPKTNSSFSQILCRRFLKAFTDVAQTTS